MDVEDDDVEAAEREKRGMLHHSKEPCVCFRLFREEGRFMLMEVGIPGKEKKKRRRRRGRG